jgi:hypothetical protein
MENQRDKTCQRLIQNLEEMTKQYRALLETLRIEKESLALADLEKIHDCTVSKEVIMTQLKSLDNMRERLAKETALVVGLNVENPRLLEIATKVDEATSQRLRTIHATLELLIKRVTELNSDNEMVAKAGLGHLNGAIDQIKETLAGKSTYEKKGKKAYGPDKSGNIVSREA